MSNSILKPIIVGVLLGTALFFVPFLVLRVAVIVLVIGLIIRLFGGWGYRRGFRGPAYPHFADRIRNMSDEEYARFKEGFQYGCGYNRPAEQATKTDS